ATADPTIMEGITRSGSAAAKGIAPSVMNESPITRFVGPDERSTGVNLFLNTTVASAIASGGTIPPIMAAVIGSGFPAVSVAILNAYAALLIGPPISIAIIPPRIAPSMTMFVPLRFSRKELSVSFKAVAGGSMI